jgi:hypothetical protein
MSPKNEMETHLVPVAHIERCIYVVRGHRVMLDSDLAQIYGVTTARLNQQVNRNLDRFPRDFMFRLTSKEFRSLMLQFATSKGGRGGRRKLPYVFTEHGAIMLATVLNSPIAVHASIQVVRAFVRIRKMLASNIKLAKKLAEIERHMKGHDHAIQNLFEMIDQLLNPSASPQRRIGFQK